MLLDQIIDAARYVPGALLAGLGLRLYIQASREMRRLHEGERDEPPPTPRAPVSAPTRMVAAICLFALGYHWVAYASGGAFAGICVPRDRWPLLVLGVVAAVGLSRLTDVLEWEGRGGGRT